QLDQDLGGNTLGLADQTKKYVFCSDVVVSELECLSKRQLQNLLGARGEGNVSRRRLLALADDLLDLLPNRFEADTKALPGLGGDTLTLVDEAEQDVLRTDVVVVEHPGLFLGQN